MGIEDTYVVTATDAQAGLEQILIQFVTNGRQAMRALALGDEVTALARVKQIVTDGSLILIALDQATNK